MDLLVQYGKCGAINTYDTTTNEYYVIMFISEAYTFQNNTIIDEQIITSDELVVKANFFDTCKTALIGIGINIHRNRLS